MLTIQQYAKGATIPQNYLGNARLTVGIVNEIFNAFPNQFTFNSGYRTPAHNAAVGGVANSFHVQALAADVTPLNGNYDKYKSALTAIVAKYGWEVIDERNKNHFHLEPSNKGTSATPVSHESDNQQLIDNQLPPIFNYQPQPFSDQFNSSNQQNKTVIVGAAFLVLIFLLSD